MLAASESKFRSHRGAGVDLGDGQIFKRDRLKFHDGVLSVVLTAIRRSSMGRSVRANTSRIHHCGGSINGRPVTGVHPAVRRWLPSHARAVASNVALAVVSPPTFGAALIEIRHRGVPLVDSVDQNRPWLFFQTSASLLQRKWNSVCSCVSSIDFMLCLFIFGSLFEIHKFNLK